MRLFKDDEYTCKSATQLRYYVLSLTVRESTFGSRSTKSWCLELLRLSLQILLEICLDSLEVITCGRKREEAERSRQKKVFEMKVSVRGEVRGKPGAVLAEISNGNEGIR